MNEEPTFLAPEKPGFQGGVCVEVSQHIKKLSHFIVLLNSASQLLFAK